MDSAIDIEGFPRFAHRSLNETFLQKCNDAIYDILGFLSVCTSYKGKFHDDVGYEVWCTRSELDSIIKPYSDKAVKALDFFK
jgi:hypothetical protein